MTDSETARKRMILLPTLRLFWDKNVPRVSAGAFGMVVRGKPYEKSDLEWLVSVTDGVRWNGEWMVKDD